MSGSNSYENPRDVLNRQLAFDYCLTQGEVADHSNHFSEFQPLDGRRQFRTSDDCPLKVAAVNGKLLFTGKKEIVEACRKLYTETSGDWFMDIKNFRALDALVIPYGYRLESAHPFFLPDFGRLGAEDVADVVRADVEIVKYDRDAIEQFRGDERFSNAYSFEETAPDMLGVGAVSNGEFLGMAGASADSDLLWQIGIDVMPQSRGKHIGATLVSILKHDILESGRMPFYGTSMSNTGSQRVAYHAGFIAAWSELYAKKETN